MLQPQAAAQLCCNCSLSHLIWCPLHWISFPCHSCHSSLLLRLANQYTKLSTIGCSDAIRSALSLLPAPGQMEYMKRINIQSFEFPELNIKIRLYPAGWENTIIHFFTLEIWITSPHNNIFKFVHFNLSLSLCLYNLDNLFYEYKWFINYCIVCMK